MKLLLLILFISVQFGMDVRQEDQENQSPKKQKLERQKSKSFMEDKKEPDEHTKTGWKDFAVCMANKNIFKELMDNINGQLGAWGSQCSVPLIGDAWNSIRCVGYADALKDWATEENMVNTLMNFQALWQNDECTQALVDSNTARVRADRQRRRLKKFKESDTESATSTWGLSMSVGISVVKYQMSWSLGFVVNNCGCDSWGDDLDKYKRNPELKEGEMNDEYQKHKDVEFFCINNEGKCWLPTVDGQCTNAPRGELTDPPPYICKNTGVTWTWGKSSTLGLGTDLIKSLGLSALGGGVSVGVTYNYDIPEINCAFFPGVSLGASTAMSWGNDLVGLGGSLSATVRVACPTNSDCGPTEVRYCGTSLGVGFSTNANLASIVLFIEDVIEEGFNKASELLKGPTIDLDLQINLPLPAFLSILSGGGPIKGKSAHACAIAAFSLGPAIYDKILPDAEYPFAVGGKWGCTGETTVHTERATRIPQVMTQGSTQREWTPFDSFIYPRHADHSYWYADPLPDLETKLAEPNVISKTASIRQLVALPLFLVFLLVCSTKAWKPSLEEEYLLAPV